MITGIEKPCIAISPLTGIVYVGGFDGSDWKCYAKFSDDVDFELMGTITTGSSDQYAGMEVSNNTDGRIVFAVQNSGNVDYFESTNNGKSWSSV